MTNSEIARAFELRLEGFTLQEIADQFGASRQYISVVIPRVKERRAGTVNVTALREYLLVNQITISHLARLCGVTDHSLRMALTTDRMLNINFVIKIHKATGIPYDDLLKDYESRIDIPHDN